MSRHKFIKNLYLDDEFDDFDGIDENNYSCGDETELSKEDQEKMRIGTIAVRADLPLSLNVSDAQIQESLWHTYYDVDRTVAFLTKKFTAHNSNSSTGLVAKQIKGVSFNDCYDDESAAKYGGGYQHSRDIAKNKLKTSSYRYFFIKMPWLNIPQKDQTTFIAPSVPRCGLLGGSSSSGPPKISKLQALAATRKKMLEQQKSKTGMSSEDPLALLNSSQCIQAGATENSSNRITPRSFPIRKRRVSNPIDPNLNPTQKIVSKLEENSVEENNLSVRANPSAFASTMFSSIPSENPRQHFIIPCPTNISLTDPFVDPSPDDVVLAAQSKGLKKPGRSMKDLGN